MNANNKMNNHKEKHNWQELMKQAQAGNEDAYRVVLERVYSYLKSYLYKRITNQQNREDLIQEIVVALHKARHTYDPNQPFFPWISAISRYKMISYFRKTQKSRGDIGESSTTINLFTDKDNVEEHNLKIELDEYLSKLPQKQRDLLYRVKIDGYSTKEAAKEFGMSISNVKTTIHRALSFLRRNTK